MPGKQGYLRPCQSAITCSKVSKARWENRKRDAEGATASETLRPKDQRGEQILESGINLPAEGIAISGARTEEALFGLWPCFVTADAGR